MPLATMAEKRSPILAFVRQIAGSAFAVAPERETELRAVASNFSISFSDERKFRIRVNMQSHEATFPIATLEYLWACAYLFWVLYQQYSAAQSRGEVRLDLSSMPDVRDAIEVFNWARTNQAESGVDVWPDSLPRPARQQASESVLVANELFLVAVAWIMHHEIAHVRADHPAMHDIYAINQEIEADEMATDWIFENCADPAKRNKRQLGMVTALLAMQLLDELPGQNTYVGSHPPTVERLYRCLERASVDDDGAPRAFAAIAMQLQLAQDDLPIALDGASIQDILADALIRFRTSGRG